MNFLKFSLGRNRHANQPLKEHYRYLWKKYIWEDTEFLD